MIPPSTAGPAIVPSEFFDPVGNGNLPPMPYRDMPEPLPLGKVLGPSVILAGLGVGSGRVHHLAVHGLDRRARLSVGRGAQRDRAVLPQHGDRALHAGHGRDRRGRLRPVLEAVGRAVLPLHDRAEHVARMGDERRDDPDVPDRRRQRPATSRSASSSPRGLRSPSLPSSIRRSSGRSSSRSG